MNVLVLMGSPRINGNTAELCKPFIEELKNNLVNVEYIELTRLNIAPCKGCYVCQDVANEYGCVQKDDMDVVVEAMIRADTIILATPILAWYCSACMKSVLDRHYGMNKYYGSAVGNLWEGKKVGIIATHGYEGDYATGPFETGIKRFCDHSRLEYVGMYSVQDTDNIASFQTEKAKMGARKFAKQIMGE